MKVSKALLFNFLLITATSFSAHALSTPEDIRETTSNTMTAPKESPTPKEKRIMMPPPRKTPKPHNMEPPIAPMTDPQVIKKVPTTELPVPGDDPRAE